MRNGIRILFIILLIVLLAIPGTADFIDGLNAKPVTIKMGGATIRGYHFVGAKGKRNAGKPVVFLHGLSLNLHEFERLIQVRMEAGDDCYAFNWRGHGNGDERSIVQNYRNGDYRFEHLVSEDLPAIVDTVYKERRKKIVLIGHSMGGMISLASVGLGHLDGKIDSIVAIGSPAQIVEKVDGHNWLWRWYISKLINQGRGDAMLPPTLITDSLSLLNFFFPAKYLTNLLLPGVVRLSNFDKRKDGWAERAVSSEIPTDILRSFEDFGWPGRGFKYTGIQVKVPVLHIVGTQDELAPTGHIRRVAKYQAKDPGHWMIQLTGASHLDLLASKLVSMYRDLLDEFLRKPTRLGTPNKTCVKLLVL